MHWTLFTDPGWRILGCVTPQCQLSGGGNYAVLQGPRYSARPRTCGSTLHLHSQRLTHHLGTRSDITIIVETFLHSMSKCIRCDPPDWTVRAPRIIMTDTLKSNICVYL